VTTKTSAPDPRRWWALFLLCTAQFLVILDTSIVGIAFQRSSARSASSPPDCSGSSTRMSSRSEVCCCSADACPTSSGLVAFSAQAS